jgi:small conductance mechanosensitive channel
MNMLRCLLAALAVLAAIPALAQAPVPTPPPVPTVAPPQPPAAAPVQPAAAQPAATPAPAPAPELERLLQTLESDGDRQRLIESLRALLQAQRQAQPAPAPTPAPGAELPDRVAGRMIEAVAQEIGGVGAAILRAASFIADAPKLWQGLTAIVANPLARERIVETTTTLVVILVVALGAEWLVRFALRRARERHEISARKGGWRRWRDSLLHMLLAILPVAAFGVIAFAVLGLIAPSFVVALIAATMIRASLIARAIGVVSWMVLAPRVPQLRLLPIADETAAYFHVWVRRLAATAIYGQFLAEAVYIVGLPYAGYVFLLKLLGVVVALMLVVLILQNRATVAAIIAGRVEPKPEEDAEAAADAAADTPARHRARRWLADYWHVPTLAFVALVLATWLLRQDDFGRVIGAATLTVIEIGAAWLLARVARRLVRRAFTIGDELKQRFPTLEARASRYSQIFDITAVVAIWAFAAAAILEAWGLRSLQWLVSQTGRRITSSAVSIALTVVVAFAIWEGVRIALDRYVGRSVGVSLQEQRRAARVRTMIPLINRVMMMVLGAFVALVVLSELGVNIAPLLALSGAVGIAVGLGAQQLMKDLIAGVSMVMEDTVAIGDAVTIGDKSGVVEQMSLRALKVRALDGTLHTIPFGEFKVISNMSKDFSYAVIEVQVGYKEDIDHVIAIVTAVAAEVRKDPDVGPVIRGEFEMFGAEKLGETAILYRGRFKTLPGRGAIAVRAFNRLIRRAFEREGIEMQPQRTVLVMPEGVEVTRSAPRIAAREVGE